MGLKVTLPHLSLSRPSSKRGDKSNSNNSSRPPTPSTAPANLNSSAASGSSSSSAGGSPPQGSTAPSSVDNGNVSPLLQPTNNDRKQGERRSSMGALGAALRRTVTASTPISSPTISPAGSGTSTPRTTSDGALPAKHAPGAITSTTKPIAPRDKLKRSPKSGQVPLAAKAAAAVPHAASQPPASRLGAFAAGIARGGSSKASPAATPHVHGSQTPVGPAAMRAAPVGALEESYVAKVSQRLGEAVNRVFVAAPAGANGGAHALGDLNVAGRLAPRIDRAKDAADMVVNELAAAMPDSYLLKTIIRSSVLKSLSLFLTRLSALLLACPPLSLPLPAVLPVEVRFNLAVVRAAHTMATGLRQAGQLHNAPPFIAETLNPWAIKMEEVTSRVMTPFMNSLRAEIVRITLPAQLEHAPAAVQPAAAAPVVKGHLPTASSLRALSLPLSRSGSPAPVPSLTPVWLTELGVLLDGFGKIVRPMECGPTGDRWLVTLGTFALWKAMLSLSARAIDSDTAVPVHAAVSQPVGKTLFAASAKLKSHSNAPLASPSQSPELHPTELLHPAPGSRASSHHRTLSPGSGLSPARGGSGSPRDKALQRVINELEMLEARLQAYTAYLSGPLAPAAVWSECCVSTGCEMCRTARGFDPQSDSEEEERESGHGLAQDAFREAMQTLSAMIVVAIATKFPASLRKALKYEAGGGRAIEKREESQLSKPLTPAAMLGMTDVTAEPAPIDSCAQPMTKSLSSSSHREPLCPTLRAALPEVPALLVLHLLIARLPSSLGFRGPTELFGLEGFEAYAGQFKSFAQSEEWEGELAYEVEGEMDRVEGEEEGREDRLTKEEQEALDGLEWALKAVRD